MSYINYTIDQTYHPVESKFVLYIKEKYSNEVKIENIKEDLEIMGKTLSKMVTESETRLKKLMDNENTMSKGEELFITIIKEEIEKIKSFVENISSKENHLEFLCQTITDYIKIYNKLEDCLQYVYKREISTN